MNGITYEGNIDTKKDTYSFAPTFYYQPLAKSNITLSLSSEVLKFNKEKN